MFDLQILPQLAGMLEEPPFTLPSVGKTGCFVWNLLPAILNGGLLKKHPGLMAQNFRAASPRVKLPQMASQIQKARRHTWVFQHSQLGATGWNLRFSYDWFVFTVGTAVSQGQLIRRKAVNDGLPLDSSGVANYHTDSSLMA
jgi:hypothetical protein